MSHRVSPEPRQLAALFYAVLTLITPSLCRADAAAVLAAEDDDAKAMVLIKDRRGGVDAAYVQVLAAREKSNAIVGLALGLLLEGSRGNNGATPEEAAAAIAFVAKRRGMHGDAAMMGAMAPKVGDIVATLAGHDQTKPLAAGILAHYARLAAMPEPNYGEQLDAAGQPIKNPKRGRGRGNSRPRIAAAQLTEHLKTLLAERDEETLEPAILAAAYTKNKDVAELIEPLLEHRSTEIKAAALLYVAKTGKPLPKMHVDRVFASRAKVPAQYTRLSPLLSNYDVTVSPHCYAAEAIGDAGDAAYLGHLHKALTSRDLRVQIDAARALEKIASPDSVVHLVRVMKKCDWPVLVSVTAALGAIPSTDAIEPLIERLGDEKGRFRLDVLHALSSIAGEQKGSTPEHWLKWWDENRETFKPDPKKTAAFRAKKRVQDVHAKKLGFFYHTSIYSDRVVFTLDTSKSMRGEKFESLKRNLKMTLESLANHVRFNVADFGGHVRVMIPGRMMNAQAGAEAAIHQLSYFELTLGTRSYDGIEAAIATPGMDTIMFLSDGAPVASKLNAWGRIIGGLHLLNRYRPVAVYAVEFNASAANLAALREMAARYWGESASPN